MGKSWENPTTKKGLHGKFMGNPTKIDVHMGNSWENHTKIEVYMVKSWENPTTNEGLHGKIMGKPSDKKRFTWEIQGKPNKHRCSHGKIMGNPTKIRTPAGVSCGSCLFAVVLSVLLLSCLDFPLGADFCLV